MTEVVLAADTAGTATDYAAAVAAAAAAAVAVAAAAAAAAAVDPVVRPVVHCKGHPAVAETAAAAADATEQHLGGPLGQRLPLVRFLQSLASEG